MNADETCECIKEWIKDKICQPGTLTIPPPVAKKAQTPVPQEPLPENKKKSLKYMIDLCIINWDHVEMVAEVKQLYTAQYHAAVVNEMLNIAIEKSAKEIGIISKALLNLVASNTISPDNFVVGTKEILEFAPDLYIDIPMLYDHLGKIIAPQIEKKHITFVQIFRISESIISAKHGSLFLKAMIKDLKESMGPSFVKSKWQESGLQIKQWMDEKLVTMWLEDNKFEFLEVDSKVTEEKKIILTPAQTQSKLIQLMNADETCDCIKGWIQDKIGNSTNEDWFMQALIQAICLHALFWAEGHDAPLFNQDRMNKYACLIHDFGETKQSREACCLFGIQQLMRGLKHPQANRDMPHNYSKGASIERSTFNSRAASGSSSCSSTRSTSAAPATPPGPVSQESLPEPKKKSIKSMIDFCIITSDHVEMVAEVKHLCSTQYQAAVVNEILTIAVGKSAIEVAVISKALLSLVASNTISPDNFVAGMKEILQSDIYMDVSRLIYVYDNLGKIIAQQILYQHITFVQIFRLSLIIISAQNGHRFLQAVIRYLNNRMRPSFIKSDWQESSVLQTKQWMDEKLDKIWRPRAPKTPPVANEAPAPAPVTAPVPQKPLPENTKKFIKPMIDLCIINWDHVEMVAEVKQLYTAQYHAAVVNEMLNIAIEKSAKEIAFISKALLNLVASNTISPDNFVVGTKEILEFAPDLYIDIPMLYDYLGKIIAPQIEKKHITFVQIFRISESIISAKHGSLFLKAMIKDLKESMGPSFVKSKWQESGLQIKQWMDEKLVTTWLEVNKFEFLEVDSKVTEKKKIILTPAQTQSKLMELMNADETCEHIKGWIQDKVGKSTNEDWFMRALIQAKRAHDLYWREARDDLDVNQARMNTYDSLIHDFGQTKQSREETCLVDVQQLRTLEHPQEAEEDTISHSNADNDNEDSQSLILPKKCNVDYTDLSTKVIGANSGIIFTERDLTDAQPLFTDEANKNTTLVTAGDKTRKIKKNIKPNNEDCQALIINPSNNRRSNEGSSSAVTKLYCSDINANVIEAQNSKKFSNEQKSENDTEYDLQSQNGDNVSSATCIDCIFDKELDKRNYHFGNLLIGELQLLPACMRSEAYLTILSYVDSLKEKHRKKVNA